MGDADATTDVNSKPDPDGWLKYYEPKYVEEVNIFPNITVFNRKLYTFGPSDGEAYIKFKSYDKSITSYDDLCFLDTKTCGFRIDEDRYIVTLHVGDKWAVIGELSERYITKNELNSYGTPVRTIGDKQMASLKELYNPKDYISAKELCDCAYDRIKNNFDNYYKHIQQGNA
ncbi:hypothetical protein I9W82_001637 [Candida metapsilosis]|uniref:Uncharacterized protein n=1 Tax=Candida metapsilosis TaxID=273372 RepID=A0A8H7ZD72_9ASCO|nr:hypothetical protein I9W82_001637 [Candida metapsilosis]